MGERSAKNFLIKRKMQISMAVKMITIGLVFTAFVAFEVYISVWPVVSGFLPAGFSHAILTQIVFRFSLYLIPIVLVVLCASIILTHRIAGPVFIMEKTISAVLKGEDAPLIKLRRNDELKDLADKINELLKLVKEASSSGDGAGTAREG